ncbi:MAG: DUF4058 family protein [Chloroflexota bacterium]
MMEAVHSVKNQYLGVNAHLHSFWQGEHKWNRFHNAHITDLAKLLRVQLIPKGYTAEIEESLQIRRIGDDLPHRPRPDILVRDSNPTRKLEPTYLSGVQVLELADLMETELDIEHPYYAIVIYERTAQVDSGEAVAWIELLSPTNKGDNRDAYTYFAKRQLALEGGKVFVELDYLHESPPTFERLPNYSTHKPDANPYRITILDPRPNHHDTRVYLKEFSVDEPIPVMTIPLNDGDYIEFDFGDAYRKTYEEMLYGTEEWGDYAQLPLNFDRYSPADQARIVNRMLAVLNAAQSGQNLEAAHLPVESFPLDQALAQLQKLK